jgi:hypothetical protein
MDNRARVDDAQLWIMANTPGDEVDHRERLAVLRWRLHQQHRTLASFEVVIELAQCLRQRKRKPFLAQYETRAHHTTIVRKVFYRRGTRSMSRYSSTAAVEATSSFTRWSI